MWKTDGPSVEVAGKGAGTGAILLEELLKVLNSKA